jgi:serine acetyltransferase
LARTSSPGDTEVEVGAGVELLGAVVLETVEVGPVVVVVTGLGAKVTLVHVLLRICFMKTPTTQIRP